MRTRIARLAGALLICLLLAGCASPGSNAGSIVGESKDNASIVTCRTNRNQLAEQYSTAQSTSGAPVEFATVLAEQNAKCPSGGTYTWDDAASKVVCSVHGQ